MTLRGIDGVCESSMPPSILPAREEIEKMLFNSFLQYPFVPFVQGAGADTEGGNSRLPAP